MTYACIRERDDVYFPRTEKPHIYWSDGRWTWRCHADTTDYRYVMVIQVVVQLNNRLAMRDWLCEVDNHE